MWPFKVCWPTFKHFHFYITTSAFIQVCWCWFREKHRAVTKWIVWYLEDCFRVILHQGAPISSLISIKVFRHSRPSSSPQPCLLLSMYMFITRKKQSLSHDPGPSKAVPFRSLCVRVSRMAKLWLLQPESGPRVAVEPVGTLRSFISWRSQQKVL